MTAPAQREIEVVQETLTADDGTQLHYQEWRPQGEAARPTPRGLVLIVHGYGEHIGRYDWPARQLNAAGFVAGGADHRGMGRSGGPRGFVRDYEEYVADLAVPQQRLRASAPPGTPLFVYGHSMGGLIALRHAETRSVEAIAGTLLSGPLLGVAMPVPAWQIRLGRPVSRFFPRFRVPVPFDPTMLTHDEDERADTAADRLNLQFTTLGWFFASGRAMEQAHAEISRLAWPTLWLIPGDDKLCSSAASRAVFETLPQSGVHAWRDYPGLFHELHKERPADRARVLADALSWLEARLAELGR